MYLLYNFNDVYISFILLTQMYHQNFIEHPIINYFGWGLVHRNLSISHQTNG